MIRLVSILVWLGAAGVFIGCAHEPASRARQTLTGAYAADGAGAAIGSMTVKKCASDAVETAKADPAKGQAALDGCKKSQSILSRALHAYTDVVGGVAAAVDAYEKIAAKDYSGALAPLYGAGVEFGKGLTEAGVKIPLPIPGVNQ